MSARAPVVLGVQEHVAVIVDVPDVATDPQPVIVVPSSLKLTVPAWLTVAVIVTAALYVAVVADAGSKIENVGVFAHTVGEAKKNLFLVS